MIPFPTKKARPVSPRAFPLLMAALVFALCLLLACGAADPSDSQPESRARYTATAPLASTDPPAAQPVAAAVSPTEATAQPAPSVAAETAPTEAPVARPPAAAASPTSPAAAATEAPPTTTLLPTPAAPQTVNFTAPPTGAPTATSAPPPEPMPPPVPVGAKEGQRIPDFSITLADGSVVTSQLLLEANQPTFLFFFATW